MRLVTLNVLCPHYYRIGGGEYEAARPQRAVTRLRAVAGVLAALEADVICLQEFSFDAPFRAAFEDALGADFAHLLARRPCQKRDGLAIFARRDTVEVLPDSHRRIDLWEQGAGNRVAQVATLRERASGRTLALLNVHLTFPHDDYDRTLRAAQMAAALPALERAAADAGADAAAVVGDLNDVDDEVFERLLADGFASAFGAVHGREAGVTHCNHREQQVGVDFVMLRGGAAATAAVVLPRGVPDDEPMLRPPRAAPGGLQDGVGLQWWSALSDHRPVSVSLSFSGGAGGSCGSGGAVDGSVDGSGEAGAAAEATTD